MTMFCIAKKLENIKQEAMACNKALFGGIQKQKIEIKEKMEVVQERMVEVDLLEVAHEEEKSWRQ